MNAAIQEVVRGKTLLIIAHKLQSVVNADKICVLEKGKLAGIGKHEELLKSCGEYQKLWKASVESLAWKISSRSDDEKSSMQVGRMERREA